MKMELILLSVLTIDESLLTQRFHSSNQIFVSIIQIRDLRDIENLLKELSEKKRMRANRRLITR